MSNQNASALVVDDHPLFVDALCLALQSLTGGGQVATASSLAEACARLAAQRFDLVLLDLVLPDAVGMEGLARVRELMAGARVVVISGRSDPTTISLARAIGVAGFISKTDALSQIQKRLRAVMAGEAVFPEDDLTPALVAKIAKLTPAQARVLAAAATGKLNKQIAADMNLAEATIKTHMSAILRRLRVNNRTQAILALTSATSP